MLKRRFESQLASGNTNPLPTRTPIATVLEAYVQHIRAVKTPKNAQNDIYYLREAFGPICEAMQITSRTPSAKARKRPSKSSRTDRRRKTGQSSALIAPTVSAAIARPALRPVMSVS